MGCGAGVEGGRHCLLVVVMVEGGLGLDGVCGCEADDSGQGGCGGVWSSRQGLATCGQGK